MCCLWLSNTLNHVRVQIHQVVLQRDTPMLVLCSNFLGARLREREETSWTLWSHFWRLHAVERLGTLQATQRQQTQTNFAVQNPWSGQPAHNPRVHSPPDCWPGNRRWSNRGVMQVWQPHYMTQCHWESDFVTAAECETSYCSHASVESCSLGLSSCLFERDSVFIAYNNASNKFLLVLLFAVPA